MNALKKGPGFSLSIVLPAFNEAPNIQNAMRHCLDMGKRLFEDFEIIVVDDGSVDGTADVVCRVAKQDVLEHQLASPRVRLIQHETNLGYGAALRSGFQEACMEYVFFTDADLQFNVEEIVRCFPFTKDYDIVVGYRNPRKDPWLRRANGRLWSWLVGVLFSVKVRDINCAFKLFKRSVLEKMTIGTTGACVNAEILAKAKEEQHAIKEIPVSHFPRANGTATGANFNVILRAFSELRTLYEELKNGESGLGYD